MSFYKAPEKISYNFLYLSSSFNETTQYNVKYTYVQTYYMYSIFNAVL